MEMKEVIQKNAQPLKIRLSRSPTGYNWEVCYVGSDLSDVVSKVRDANAALREEYGKC